MITLELKPTEGIKYDKNKARLDLIPKEALDALGSVLQYGANKYGDRNWEKGMEWHRVYGALQRHLWAFWSGEDTDPESGLPHLEHALANAAFLLTYYKRKIGTDDRSLGPKSTESVR